jgi:hypothetical protein
VLYRPRMRLVVLSRPKARLRAEISKSLLFTCFSYRLILYSARIAPAPTNGNSNTAAPLVLGIAMIPATRDSATTTATTAITTTTTTTTTATTTTRGNSRFFSCLFTSLASHL